MTRGRVRSSSGSALRANQRLLVTAAPTAPAAPTETAKTTAPSFRKPRDWRPISGSLWHQIRRDPARPPVSRAPRIAPSAMDLPWDRPGKMPDTRSPSSDNRGFTQACGSGQTTTGEQAPLGHIPRRPAARPNASQYPARPCDLQAPTTSTGRPTPDESPLSSRSPYVAAASEKIPLIFSSAPRHGLCVTSG